MTSHWLVWPVWEVILSTCKMCYVFRSFWGTFKGLLWTSMKWVWNIKGMQFLFFFLIWRRTVHRFIKVSSSVVFPWNGKQRPPVASVTSFTKKAKKGMVAINLAPDCQKMFHGDVLENLEKKKTTRKTIERGQKITKWKYTRINVGPSLRLFS